MSKMGQIHMELTEKAAELGFKSIEDAEAHGLKPVYYVDGGIQRARFVPKSPTKELDELEEAIKAQIDYNQTLANDLEMFLVRRDKELGDDRYLIECAIDAIREAK